MVIKFSVREQTISLLPTKSIPRIGSKDYLILQFVFSNDWDRLSKVVYLQKDSVSEPIELVGDTLKVPEWFTEQDTFNVTLLGVGDTQEVPTNVVSIKLEKSNTLWNEDAPVPQPSWLVTVLEAAKRVEDASVNSPKIGDNGNWFVWDFELGKYVDTGVAASSGGSGAVSSVNGKTGAIKLTAEDVGAVPVPKTASVGQTIVVKAVDDAGKPTEWEAVDAPSGGGAVDDVQIDGVSIVENGVANVPVSIADNRVGQPCLVRISSLNYGIYLRSVDDVPGHLAVCSASDWSINNGRNEPAPLFMKQTDRTIKACMCDGVGAAWTDAERIAALLRMGCTVDDNGFVRWTEQEVSG